MPTTGEVTAVDYQLSTEHGKMEVFHHSDASHDETYKARMTSVPSGVGDTGLDNPEVSILFSPENGDADILLSFKRVFEYRNPMVQWSLVKIATAQDGTRSMSCLGTDTQVMYNVTDIKEKLPLFCLSTLRTEPTQALEESGIAVFKDLATWFDTDAKNKLVEMGQTIGQTIADGLSMPLGGGQPRIVIVPGIDNLSSFYNAAWRKYPDANLSAPGLSSTARSQDILPFYHLKNLEDDRYKVISMFDANKPEVVISLALSTSKPTTALSFASHRHLRDDEGSGLWHYWFATAKNISAEGIEEAIKTALDPEVFRSEYHQLDAKQGEDAAEWRNSPLGPCVEAMLKHEHFRTLLASEVTVKVEEVE